MVNEIKKSNWKNLLVSIGVIMGAFLLYDYLDEIERSGGSIRMNWIFILIYTFAGKFYASLILFLIGIWMFYDYIKETFLKNENNKN